MNKTALFSQTWLAPAKLNLFLHITGRCANGYHCLQTIFQFLDYADILHFHLQDDDKILCDSSANIPPTEDLTVRAATILKNYTQTKQGIHIQVEKKLPIGAGLGGGSSNAATTLLALNQLWQCHLPLTTLAALGLNLGADVPIFINGQTAWAEGVGEKLSPLPHLPEPWYLIVNPNCQIATGKIFSDPGLTRNMLPITMRDFLEGKTKNVCEPIVRQRYPEVAEALDWLNQRRQARLTGTGACIFAAFDDQRQAQAQLQNLPKKWQGFVAQGKNQSPAHQPFTIR